MVHLTSSTQTAEELTEALRSSGLKIDDPADPRSATVSFQHSVPTPEKPGESPKLKPEGETALVSETKEDKPQESKVEEKATDDEPEKPKVAEPKQPERGNFETRRKQLERKVDRLHDDLELERGSKAQLQAKLDAATAELEKLKPAPTEAVKKDDLVKPKRPTLAECDFDNDKFEEALAKHEDEALPQYYRELTLRTVKEENAKADADRKAAEVQRVAQAAFNSFVERKEAGRKQFDDYDDLLEQLGNEKVDFPDAVELAVLESDNPADLIHYFMNDVVNNDGKELDSIQKLSPVRQVKALAKLEERLVSEREARGKAPASETAVETEKPAAAAPPEKPAKQKPVATPHVDPIEPVGSRASGGTPKLDDAKTTMDYIRLRNQGVNR